MKHYDAIIIGFGKGGKTLAGELAKHEKKVALIEKSNQMYGGTCINEGCIPSKSLIVQADKKEYEEAIEQKEKLINKLRQKNYDKLAQKELIDIIDGTARFIDNHTVEIDHQEQISADYIFINTGSKSIIPPIQGIQEAKHIYTSASMMKETQLPQHLAIIGGGYIGLEFASMYARYGSQVTVFEFNERLVGREDEDVALEIQHILENQGVQFKFSSRVQEVSNQNEKVVVQYSQNDVGYIDHFDAVLLATGRAANTDDLGLENTDVKVDQRGQVIVNEYLQTDVPHIYAMGDVKGGLQFTYISLDDYRIVKDYLFGKQERTVNNRGHIPYSVFISPPFSRVGLSEQEALQQGYEIKVAKIPTASIPRANVDGKPEGLLKAIVDKNTDQILGCVLLCERSEEMINFVQLAMNLHLKYQDIASHIFTHPSMSEALNDLFNALQ